MTNFIIMIYKICDKIKTIYQFLIDNFYNIDVNCIYDKRKNI